MAEYIIDVPYNIERVDTTEVDSGTTLVGFSVREEIIRCRDCKFRAYNETLHRDECTENFNCIGVIYGEDAYAERIVDPNGFCAWAERSE